LRTLRYLPPSAILVGAVTECDERVKRAAVAPRLPTMHCLLDGE
jgi:hypothetical protein